MVLNRGQFLALCLVLSGHASFESEHHKNIKQRGRELLRIAMPMQLLFSFDQDMRVEKTLIQTLASQLSSTLMQLLFWFDQDMRVEKTLIQTLFCQFSSTLMQLLFWFDQEMRVEKTLIQTLFCQFSSTLMQLLFWFDQEMRVEKTLIQTLFCQFSSTLMQLLFLSLLGSPGYYQYWILNKRLRK